MARPSLAGTWLAAPAGVTGSARATSAVAKVRRLMQTPTTQAVASCAGAHRGRSHYIQGDRMLRVQPHLAIGLALAAVGVASCGGSNDAGDAPLTRAQYIATTDALCKQSNARTRTLNIELRRQAAGVTSDAQLLRRLAPVLERGYGPVRDNAAAFQAANPPAADAAEVERLRALYDSQAEFVRRLARAARRVDTNAFKSLSEQQKDVVKRARRLAHRFGFKECGSTKSDAA